MRWSLFLVMACGIFLNESTSGASMCLYSRMILFMTQPVPFADGVVNLTEEWEIIEGEARWALLVHASLAFQKYRKCMWNRYVIRIIDQFASNFGLSLCKGWLAIESWRCRTSLFVVWMCPDLDTPQVSGVSRGRRLYSSHQDTYLSFTCYCL